MTTQQVGAKNEIIWNAVGNAIYLGLQWLLTILITRINGYSAAGDFSLAMSISNTVSCISHWGIRYFQVSDLTSEYSDTIYYSSRWLTCFIAFIICAIFLWWNHYTIYQAQVILVYLLFKTSESLVDVLHGFDQKAHRLDYAGISWMLRGVLGFLVFAVILLISANLITSIMGMAIVSYLVIFIYDFPRSKNLSSFNHSFSLRGSFNLLKTCFPTMIYTFCSTSLITIPRWFLERVWGNDVLGIYASVATPTVIIQVVTSYIFLPLITPLAFCLKTNDKKAFIKIVAKCTFYITLFSGICIGASFFLGKWGLKVLFGEEIVPYSYMLAPVMIDTMLGAMVTFCGTLLTIFRNFKGLILSSIIGVATDIVLSVTVVPHFSMDGVNLTLFLTFLLQILFMLLFMRTSIKKSFNKE